MRASVIDILANTSGYVTHDYWDGSYYKSYSDVGYEFHYYRQLDWITHGFVKFDLSSMPDSCTILSAELHFYQRKHWSYTPFVGISLIPDPDSMDAKSLYDAAVSGELIAPAGSTPDGWITWSFYPYTMTQLDSCRRSGWISCAAQCLSQEPAGGIVSGCDSAEAPYLRIEYTSSGTREATDLLTRQPELTIAPNPTTGAFVTARYDIPVGTLGDITLRDALGRTTGLFDLDPSGVARLDLSGLAPGVYMATLDGTMPPVSRKLVITAR
jgi:hypothetical protein